MGCTQSKIENEEAVSRCKDRKQFMKEAVSFRNAFAAAHSAYAMSLKNTGAALSDYAQGEVPQHSASAVVAPSSNIQSSSSASSSAASSALPTVSSSGTFDTLPPPPPLPNFQTVPLQRSASMPEIKIQKQEVKPVGPTITEEDEELEFEAHNNEKLIRKRSVSTNRGSDGNNRGAVQEKHHHMEDGPQQVMRSSAVQQDAGWGDYFFPPMESIPGSSLAEPSLEEEVRANREEMEPKMFEKKSKMVEKEEPSAAAVADKVDKPAEAPAPLVERKVAKRMGGEGGRKAERVLNLMQIFAEFDDHFLKASESAHEVSKMLEATRLHYHSNFADNRGHIDHSARLMRVITWNRSFKGIPGFDDGKDDFDSEEHETHATVLDKMLAWEKKLYDEVKTGEVMKFEYQKKVALLTKQKKRGANSESLEKLKAAVSHLHTRYIVDMQSMDSTVSEINHLRDEQLYPKLVDLVDGMAAMWETMQSHHESQCKTANSLRSLDISQSPKETSEYHHDRTYQLWSVVQDWHSQFCKLIDNQKAYIKSLHNWLKLNLIPIESSLKENVSSPVKAQNPPIQALLITWLDHVEQLPDEVARTAINNFAAVIHTILQHQEEEIKLKEKCKDTQKELTRKTKQFDDWYKKYIQRRTPDELDPEGPENNTVKEAISERQFAVDILKKRLEEEEADYRRHCLHVREKSLASLKTRLPDLFRAMSDVSLACSLMYSHLRSISHRPNPSHSSS